MKSNLKVETEGGIYLWAIAQVPKKHSVVQYVVARESLDGTLVLGAAVDGSSGFEPVAYLTLTDIICGTMLVKVDESGKIDMKLRAPFRMDMMHSGLFGERLIQANIDLELKEMTSSYA
jgi:hypothetical protein